MTNDELKSIATDAITGHWPAHLGLATDADRIDWLARKVERLVDDAEDIQSCSGCELCHSHGDYE